MDFTVLVVAWLLVWGAGIAILAALPRASDAIAKPGTTAWLAGTGFFVGAFVLTLLMRALSLAGIRFGWLSIGVPLAVLAAAGAALAWRRDRAAWLAAGCTALRGVAARDLAGWMRALWFVLLAWLALRFALLLADVFSQPLYPWDAWIQWATKARAWFELRAWVPFAETEAWLAANGARYTDAAPTYPGTVPLWQVWSSVALGRWDDAWMNLPWWCMSVAFAFAIYGALRRMDFVAPAALTGTWIAVSLPLADVHVALAGYADLPMAGYFTLAALATLAWTRTRSAFDAIVALLLVVACPFIKTPGIAWVATLVPALVFAVVPRQALKIVTVGFAAGALALAVLSQTAPVVLNYQLHLDFAPAWGALFESFFMLGNWNLLWYGVIAVAALAGTRLVAPALAPFTAVIAAGLVFLFIVFGFTNARFWVESQTTVNRAVLHLAPLAAVWMVAAFREWAGRKAEAVEPAAGVAAESA